MVRWLVLALVLCPAVAGAYCSMPLCSDITNPTCQAAQQAYENCRQLERMEMQRRDQDWIMQQRQFEMDMQRNRYRRGW